MNGANSHYGQPNPWQEYKSPDGRVYYYNSITKATQWTKPEELMSPAEVRYASLYRCDRRLTRSTARSRESTMEGVYRRGWAQVLVQYRDEAKLLGNARSL